MKEEKHFSVGTALGYGRDERGSIPGMAKDLFLPSQSHIQ
jgi:hypothetical protein